MPDFLVKLTQATVRVINYQYGLTVQDNAIRSAAEDRDGANLVATGGAPDLEEESARFCQGKQFHGSAKSPDGAFIHGLAHQADRVISVSDNEPSKGRAIGRQLLLIPEYSRDGVELDVCDGQDTNIGFLGQFTSGAQVDAVVPDPRELAKLWDLTIVSFWSLYVVYLGYLSVWPSRIADSTLG